MCLKSHSCGVGSLISELVLQLLHDYTASFLPSPLALRLAAFPTPACRVDNNAPRVELSHSGKYFPTPQKFSLALKVVFVFQEDSLGPEGRGGSEWRSLSHSSLIILCDHLLTSHPKGPLS